MKGQVKGPTYTGEERVRSDGNSLLKKLFEGTKKAPAIIDAETIKNTQKAVTSEIAAEAQTALAQIFGVELKAGTPISLAKKADEFAEKQSSETTKITAEHMAYFSEFKRQVEGKNGSHDQSVIEQQLQQIILELKKLKDSSDELEAVFKDVVIDDIPEKPGIYHLTFFEGFLKLVLKMRDRVEDGVIYAKLFKSRKKEKSYSSMAKKKGTSFTLHHDRTAATQTG